MQALRRIDDWPVDFAAACAVDSAGTTHTRGDTARVVRLASVSKPVAALALLVAAEEGVVDLDEPAGPPGSTVRHLLAHTSGLPFEGGEPIARPGHRRIYSNAAYAVLAEHLAGRAEMPFAQYAREAVCEPDHGRFDPLDWGLGVQLNTRPPSWMGSRTSLGTFGHFGGTGTFLWVDPEARIVLAVLTDRGFGEWAKEAWPPFADAVADELLRTW